MQHNVPPRAEASIWVYASDLDSGSGLYGLVAAAARSLGRPIDPVVVDMADAFALGQQLLATLGLVQSGPPPVPDGVEGVHIGGRH